MSMRLQTRDVVDNCSALLGGYDFLELSVDGCSSNYYAVLVGVWGVYGWVGLILPLTAITLTTVQMHRIFDSVPNRDSFFIFDLETFSTVKKIFSATCIVRKRRSGSSASLLKRLLQFFIRIRLWAPRFPYRLLRPWSSIGMAPCRRGRSFWQNRRTGCYLQNRLPLDDVEQYWLSPLWYRLLSDKQRFQCCHCCLCEGELGVRKLSVSNLSRKAVEGSCGATTVSVSSPTSFTRSHVIQSWSKATCNSLAKLRPVAWRDFPP